MAPIDHHADTHGAWVFHRGALGDSILLWPLLRALREQHARVTLVADGSKARLASRFLGDGVIGIDAEQPRFNALFRASDRPARDFRAVNASRVLCFLFAREDDTSRAWRRNAQEMFPAASIEMVHARPDAALARAMAPGRLHPPRRTNPDGSIVVHVGAGSPLKRWPIERWESFEPFAWKHGLRFFAGEAENDAFDEWTWHAFANALGGQILTDLDALADAIAAARLFVGFDTGPSHLAAQLGVPTLALFGPTDPVRWGPIGPTVRILAPARPTPDMAWLEPGIVERAIREMASIR